MDAVNQGRGVNEILAIDDHEFLVLERDNRTFVPTPPNASQSPNLKRLYKIDLASTPRPTDVSYVFSDNDLYPGLPTQIYAFAVDEKAAGIKFQRERVFLPTFFTSDFLRLLFSL